MDLFSLHSFIAVSELKSFTKAADYVGRTQSAISQQMSKLEAYLGKPLFVRGKKVELTSEGEIFLGYARKIFSLHSEVLDRFKEPELEGELRFGLPEDFATVFLSEVLADFSRVHPRILLNIECDLTLNLFNRFQNKEFDLVLVKMNRPEDFPNGIKVWSEPLRWVGDFNLINSQKPIPLVVSPLPCVYRQAAIQSLEEAARSWRIVFISPSYAGTVAAVRAGMGIAIMPENMIPDDVPVLDFSKMPHLSNLHVSLLTQGPLKPSIQTLEAFVLRKIKH